MGSECLGRFLHIIGQSPSVSKSNQLHAAIFQLKDIFEVYSMDSFKMMGNFFKVLHFNQLFLKLNRLICN